MGKVSLLEKLGLRRPPPTLEQFRDLVAKEVLRLRPQARIVRAEDGDLDIQWPEMREPKQYTVVDHFAGCLEYPGQVSDFARHAAHVIDISGDAPRPEWLAVVIRSVPVDEGPRDLIRPVVAGICMRVVVDTPRGYQFFASEILNVELGLDDEALWRRALANTRERMDLDTVPFRNGEAQQIQRADGLMASLVLFDDFWDAPKRAEGGPLVVGLFSANRIVVAPLSDGSAVAVLKDDLARVPRDREWISAIPIVRRDGRWEVLR